MRVERRLLDQYQREEWVTRDWPSVRCAVIACVVKRPGRSCAPLRATRMSQSSSSSCALACNSPNSSDSNGATLISNAARSPCAARSLARVRGHGLQLVEPKTKASAATIPLAPKAVAALRAHRDRVVAANRLPVGLVFTTEIAARPSAHRTCCVGTSTPSAREQASRRAQGPTRRPVCGFMTCDTPAAHCSSKQA